LTVQLTSIAKVTENEWTVTKDKGTAMLDEGTVTVGGR
jgi:hypothetical protein